MNKNKNIKQLFYDLYNNVKNEKANVEEFETLYRQNRKIAKLHYDVLIIYFDHDNNKYAERFANNLQSFIATEIFK